MITGGAGGLGQGVAQVARAQGARVIVLDIVTVGDELADESYVVDLINSDSVNDCFAQIGDFDVVANIAGGFAMGPEVAVTDDDFWQAMFDINVTTVRRVVSAAMPQFVAKGRGSIVNVGAYGALRGMANMGAYLAAKSAVMRLTESLSEEVKSQGINVNAVLPSVIDTPTNRTAMPDADVGQWVSPTDLGEVVCFLGSDKAKAIHGALLPVTGLA